MRCINFNSDLYQFTSSGNKRADRARPASHPQAAAARVRVDPRVITARRHPQHPTRCAHRDHGLIRIHEFEELPFLPANPAVAFARISRVNGNRILE